MSSTAAVLLMITTVVLLVAQGFAARDHCIVQGNVRRLNEEWIQDGKLCRCRAPMRLPFAGSGQTSSDAKVSCLYNGCPDFTRMLLIAEGGTFTRNGRPCVCKKGSSKYHTQSVLYHGVCEDLVGDKYEIIFD